MGRDIRVILIDLLVERSEFGHGGNQEVIQPIAEGGSVEVLLVTPQMQSEEVGLRAQEEGLVRISESDVPNWDYEYPFWEECSMEMFGNDVIFRRVAMPLHGDDALTEGWIRSIEPDAVVCSGSRRNVTMWEEWMSGGGSLMRCSSRMGIPTLGICFGHQLLCHSLGASVERAESMSSGVWELALNSHGSSDELFATRGSGEGGAPVALYSHQDHVKTVPESCLLLGSAEHNRVTAVRVMGDDGRGLPAWGVQFHPEAAKARVERAFDWGHISEEEMVAFQREHDGAGVLSSFASVVHAYID
jgi:GMP synthase-like glutamine amidotransferase|tara:strand:- start:2015 stop:2920 length:906 start_codon:yes stop_codon:yes gene_type:complete